MNDLRIGAANVLKATSDEAGGKAGIRCRYTTIKRSRATGWSSRTMRPRFGHRTERRVDRLYLHCNTAPAG
jgi:hypothetical protein